MRMAFPLTPSSAPLCPLSPPHDQWPTCGKHGGGHGELVAIVVSLLAIDGSWALSMMPFPLYAPEMAEAAIGVVRTGRLAAFALTLIILAL